MEMAGKNKPNDGAIQELDDTAQTYFDEKIPIPRDEADEVSSSCCFSCFSLFFTHLLSLRN